MMTLMAVKVCRDMGVVFVVAYEEADPHLAAAGCPVISADTDMLALGVAEWIAPEPGFWYTGKAKLYRPDSWVGTGFDAVYKQHGARGFQYAGALLGNDFTELACGVYGLGPLAVVKILTMVPAAVRQQQQQRQSGAMECHSKCRVSRQTGISTHPRGQYAWNMD